MTILTATSLSAAEAVAQLVRVFEEGRVFEILFATDLKHENKLQQSDNQTLSKQLGDIKAVTWCSGRNHHFSMAMSYEHMSKFLVLYRQ